MCQAEVMVRRGPVVVIAQNDFGDNDEIEKNDGAFENDIVEDAEENDTEGKDMEEKASERGWLRGLGGQPRRRVGESKVHHLTVA